MVVYFNTALMRAALKLVQDHEEHKSRLSEGGVKVVV